MFCIVLLSSDVAIMVTRFQGYALLRTTEMTSYDKYIQTTNQTTEKYNTSSFLEEIDAILDLLIITFSIALLAAVVVLLFIMYIYLRNKGKSSNNVEMIRHQYKIADDIEIPPQQHSNRGDVLTRQHKSSGEAFIQKKHSVNEHAGLMSQSYTKNDNRLEQYLELEKPRDVYLELEGGNLVIVEGNVYENKQQQMCGNKVGGESEEQDQIVHYENARSWKSSRNQPKKADNYHNANPDLIFANEATYQMCLVGLCLNLSVKKTAIYWTLK